MTCLVWMVIVTMIFGASIASEEKIDNSGAAQLLLQSLGKQNTKNKILITKLGYCYCN